MAMWLQAGTLLVLLALWAPGPTQGAVPPVHLCGSDLLDALQFVCEHRGFLFTRRRDTNGLLGTMSPKVGGVTAAVGGDKEEKISVVEQCCHNPCNILELENYCI